MRHPSYLSLSLLGLAVLALPACAEDAAKTAVAAVANDASLPKVGQPAPDFTLTGEDDKSYTLRNLRGRWVVLAFYPADFTKGCTAEACSIRDQKKDIEALNARIFGISVQDVKSKKGFSEQNNLNYRLLADANREVTKTYGVLSAPNGVAKRYTFYIDPNGLLREVDSKISTGTAGNDVISHLKELEKSDPPLTSNVWDQNISKAEAKVKASPDDKVAKDDLAVAYYLKGHAALANPVFRPRIKYPIALKLVNQALSLNPKLAAAQEDKATIEAALKEQARK